MMRRLERLFRPSSIAVIGGGTWSAAVIAQCQKMGFQGAIWPVHPKAETVAGVPAYKKVSDLPSAPDACFIGVNRYATVDLVAALAERHAGGAVCFASGFLEADSEDENGAELQDALLAAADGMPILGPNCYGFINYLDGALLWPDQHGARSCKQGVAIITQSSNIAINLTMQARGLPIAYVVTVGNQAQTGMAEIGMELMEDPRVTALGLHVEGFGNIRDFEALAARARVLGKRIIALKVGKSEQAQMATVSHTASLAGGDAGASAFLKRLSIPRAHDLPSFLETLKLLHVTGGLASNRIASVSCSGGEASLAADTALDHNLIFPPLNAGQRAALFDALGPMVALANPLDYQTYIWRDVPAMTRTFAAMMDPGLAVTLLIVDFPRADRCDPSDWECVIKAAVAAKAQTGGAIALVATLPELMPETLSDMLMAEGVVPFCGLQEAFTACSLACIDITPSSVPVLLPSPSVTPDLLTEANAKEELAAFGLLIPKAARAADKEQLQEKLNEIGLPLVVKAEGLAHKTEAGGVFLARASLEEARQAAHSMPCESWLVEELIENVVAELLIGVVKDPAHGFVLTLGAGGTLTEILQDSMSLLLPVNRREIEDAVASLKVSSLLSGYRGAQPAHLLAIYQAIEAVQSYVLARAEGLEEIEINPLLCTPDRAIAVDALIRRKD